MTVSHGQTPQHGVEHHPAVHRLTLREDRREITREAALLVALRRLRLRLSNQLRCLFPQDPLTPYPPAHALQRQCLHVHLFSTLQVCTVDLDPSQHSLALGHIQRWPIFLK